MDRSPDELANAIRLLLSTDEEEFAYERELRMFQFQCWLLDRSKQDASFTRSALKFAATLLSKTISRIRARNRGMSTRDCFLVAVASNDMEGILNFCFRRGLGPYSLLTIDKFPLRKTEHDKALKEIVDLNNLVGARVRLHVAGERASLNAGERLLPKLNPKRVLSELACLRFIGRG